MNAFARSLLASVTVWLLLATPGLARSEEFDQGQIWLHGNYGLFQDFRHDDRQLHLVSVGGEYVLARDFSLGLEAVGYYADLERENPKGQGVGLTARWTFLRLGRVVLFLDGGVSAATFDEHVPPGGSHSNFVERIGPGLAFRLTDSLLLTGGASYLHLSNGRECSNPGLDALGGHIGLLYAF